MAVIGFEQSHCKHYNLLDRGDTGMSELQAITESLGHNIVQLFNIQDVEDLDALVIAFPQVWFSESERKALTSFINSGKSILFMGEWGGLLDNNRILNSITKQFGVTFNTDRVCDSVEHANNVPGLQSSDALIISPKLLVGSHKLMKGVGNIIVTSACSLNLSPPAEGIAFTSPTSWSDKDMDKSPDEGEVRGSLPIIAVSQNSVFVGDASLFQNDHISLFDHKRLAKNILEWLVRE